MSFKELFPVFPEIVTDRLRLREVSLSDLTDFHSIKSDPEVTNSYAMEPHPDMEATEKWIQSLSDSYAGEDAIVWAITLQGDTRVYGTVTLWNINMSFECGELGYELHKNAWGKGYATEAASAVTEFGFKRLGLNRIEACPYSDNIPSVRLLENIGYKLEGRLRARVRFHSAFKDQLFFAALKCEWRP